MSNPTQTATELLAELSLKQSSETLKSLTWDNCHVRMERGNRILTHVDSITITGVPLDDYKLMYSFGKHAVIAYFILTKKLRGSWYINAEPTAYGDFTIHLKDVPEMKKEAVKAPNFKIHLITYKEYIRQFYTAEIEMQQHLKIRSGFENILFKWIKEGKLIITTNV